MYKYETVINRDRTAFSDALTAYARDLWEVTSSGRDDQGYWWAIVGRMKL